MEHIFKFAHQVYQCTYNRKNLYSPQIFASFDNIDLFKKNDGLFL